MAANEDKGRALTIRLPDDLHEKLRERAEADESTIAGVIRLAARQYVGGRVATA